MAHTQKGFLPILTFIVGFGLIALSIFVFANGLINYYIVERNTNLDAAFIYAGFVFVPMYLGLFLGNMFPPLTIVKQGIVFRSVLAFSKLIKWDEVGKIVEIRKGLLKGYQAIVITRPGIIPRGLYFQKLHGLINGSDLPVLLLAPRIKNKEQMLAEIEEHTGLSVPA